MEITGKIIIALEPRGGVSQRTGNPWKSQEFVIETIEQYPKRCVFNIFGEENINRYNIQIGKIYTVSFDINAREWQGRWFNDVRAWNVTEPAPAAEGQQPGAMPPFAEPAPVAQPAAAQPAPVQNADPFAAAAEGQSTDDLPF